MDFGEYFLQTTLVPGDNTSLKQFRRYDKQQFKFR